MMNEIKYNTLKMGVPSDWKDDSMIVWTGPQDGDVCPTMVIAYTDLQGKGTFEQFVTKQQEELMKAVPEFVLHEKKDEEVNGVKCIKNKHSWRSEGPSITQLQYTFLVGENSVCNVTFTHSVEKFEKAQGMFDKMINSLSLEQ